MVSLKVVSGASSCPDDHPEEVIYRQSPAISSVCTCMQHEYRDGEGGRHSSDNWLGTRTKVNLGRKYMYKSNNQTCVYYERREDFTYCRYFESIPSMNLTNIGGRKICGLRGGRNFKDAIRPLNEYGDCPEGFEVCSSGMRYGSPSSLSTFWLN